MQPVEIHCKTGHAFPIDESIFDPSIIGGIAACPFPLGDTETCDQQVVWRRKRLAKLRKLNLLRMQRASASHGKDWGLGRVPSTTKPG